MSKKRNSITTTQQQQQQQQQATPLRRSPRFLNNPPQKTHQDCPQKDLKKPRLSTGCRKSPRLNNGVDGFSSLRRSPRFSNQRNKTGGDEAKKSSERIAEESCERRVVVGLMCMSMYKEVIIDGRRGQLGVVKAERGERKERDDDGGGVRSEEIGIKSKSKRKRKRKRGEDGNNGSVQGWTKEQEVALQRAYFGLKPTPHFWKKVSKLVSGKSAQDCFDKVHSDHLTPPQHQPRSRANRLNSSALEHFSLSASKLLQPIEPKIKKSSCNKPKSHRAQKTVRQLLQKHYHVDQDHEGDLFSVLESNINPSTQAYQSNVILSTPKNVQEKQGFLQKCRERSSSGHKKPLSRFSGSLGTALVSPLVLKQVKNRALHEKYIDQLHCREAKRKAASARAEKAFTGKENRRDVHVQKMDVVKSAKNALVSDARDAINQLQHLQADTLSNSSDFDDDVVDSDNDEGDL